MSNSTTLLDTIAANQANKEVVVNALLDAASPAMLWGRHASACSGLTWGYYGGTFVDSTGAAHAIANGTVTLTASVTNYLYADGTTGAVSANTTGFPAGKVPLYSIVTGTTTVTSYTDDRSYQPSATAGGGAGTVTSVALTAPTMFAVGGSPVTTTGTLALTLVAQAVNQVFAGPSSGGSAAPGFRALVPADLPVFVASGASHAAGAVPDPGVTAGTTKFLREDSTWSVPAGGGGGVITGGANFGTGTGQIYDATDTTATTIAFKTIKAGTNVTVTNNAQDVTISASGGGGGGVPIEKTANYTAVAGDVIAANTSGGSFTVTLPSAPSAGQSVQVMDELATWAINPLTINPNGSLIERISQNQTFRKSGGCLTFTYQNSTNGWLLNGDIPGTKWNEFDSTFDALRSLSDGRTIAVVTANASAHSIRADTVQSSGKYYFEFKLLRVEAGGAPLIGVGNSFASLTNYCGVDANGFGMYSNGQLFHFGGQTTYTSYAANDIVGVAVDLTPTTGSVTFYKNNVVNGTVTGQTLSPMYPMASGSGSNNYATGMGRLCTRAADCIYAPPAGFSYWDV